MNRFLRTLYVVLCSIGLFTLSGCISRTRYVKRVPVTQLKTASLDQLIATVNQHVDAIKTLNATVEIATTVGDGSKDPKKKDKDKKKVKDYEEIPGYLLIRDPKEIRLVGLVPVVRTRLFDMVSDGSTFSLSIPPKNKFITGSSEVEHVSDNSMENIRPQTILDALLFPHIDPANDIVVLRTGNENVQDLHVGDKQIELPTHVIAIIKKGPKNYYVSRRIVFSRADLRPRQQEIYDTEGNVVTQANYENFTDTDGTDYPYLIRIVRPKEEYEITITIDKLRINQPLTREQFELKQPEGSQLQVLK
jgi:hypothetical protein